MLSLRIALRYLLAKKSHSAVNVIALVAISGVGIATLAMVVVMSVFNGFEQLVESQLSLLDPEIAIARADGQLIGPGDSIAEVVNGWDEVAVAVPTLSDRGLVVTPTSQAPVRFKGVGDGYDELTDISSTMIDGTYDTSNTGGYPASQFSVGVANNLLTVPNPTGIVNLYVPRRQGRINPANPGAAFRGTEMVVSGVFRVDNSDVDADNIIVPLSMARELLDRETEASVIEVKLAPGVDSRRIAELVETRLGREYIAQTRIEQRAESYRMIQVEKWVTFMMLIFILVITLFNVISTLSLLVIEKRDNMATLRALGASPRLIGRVFLSEGFLVTIVGGIIGIVLGVGLSLAQQYGRFLRLSADPANLSIAYYPVRVLPTDILIIFGVIAGTAVIVGLITRIFIGGGRTYLKQN